MSQIVLVVPPLKIRLPVSAEKIYTFGNKCEKQLVSNSAHMVLHGDAQTFNRRNKKKNLNVLLLESEYFYTFVSLL